MSSSRPARSFFSARGAAAITSLAAALAVLAGAADAVACDCAISNHAAPSATDTNVPSNTKVWFIMPGCGSPTLQKTDGTLVPSSTSTLRQTTIIHPDAPLEVGSTYEVVGCFGDTVTPVTTFTVSAGPDNEPPSVPSFSASNPESGGGSFSSCGEYEYVPLVVDQKERFIAVDIARRSTLDPETISGGLVDLFFPTEKPVLVGNSICGPSNWNFADDGEATDTRLAAFDFAGNFSGWSAAETIDPGCGCEAAGAEPGPRRGLGAVAVALAALALGRLRGRRRA